jgi:transposase
VKNQLQFLAMSQGVCRRRKLWSTTGRKELEGLELGAWARRRRGELLELLDQLEPKVVELDEAVEAAARRRPEVVRLMTQKGVGPVVGLALAHGGSRAAL